MPTKAEFETSLKTFAETLTKHVSTDDGQWTVKGFIDTFRNIYTISSDTKIVKTRVIKDSFFKQFRLFTVPNLHGLYRC